MDDNAEVFTVSSESSLPSSPCSYEPKIKVSDLCSASPLGSEFLPDYLDQTLTNYDDVVEGNFQGDGNAPEAGEIIIDLLEEATPPSLGVPQESKRYHDMSETDEEDNHSNRYSPLKEEVTSESTEMESQSSQAEIIGTNDIQKKTGKGRQRLTKEEREKLKGIKAKEKAEKKAIAENLRRLKPGECLKHTTALLDKKLCENEMFSSTLDAIKDSLQYRLVEQKEQYSITWIREVPSGNSVQEEEQNQMLLVWPRDEMLTCLKYCTLTEKLKQLQKSNSNLRISLVVIGINEYIKKLKAREKQTLKNQALGGSNAEENEPKRRRKAKDEGVTLSQIEMALTEVEIILGISIRLIDNPQNLGMFIQQFHKAVAEIKYRKEREKKDMEKTWYVKADSRNCVRVDKDYNGLSNLWVQQLQQFNHSTIDMAKSIASIYPTPLCLYEAYQKCSTQKEKETLLQDIQVKRTAGPTQTRRIGPELSKKVCRFFMETNGEVLLSQG